MENSYTYNLLLRLRHKQLTIEIAIISSVILILKNTKFREGNNSKNSGLSLVSALYRHYDFVKIFKNAWFRK
jgi:hypothetical protein